MSARRKHVRAHVHDLDVEINEKEGDVVCRVEDVKGGNVIEVCICILFFPNVTTDGETAFISLSDSRS
jgi:hypothetical protein